AGRQMFIEGVILLEAVIIAGQYRAGQPSQIMTNIESRLEESLQRKSLQPIQIPNERLQPSLSIGPARNPFISGEQRLLRSASAWQLRPEVSVVVNGIEDRPASNAAGTEESRDDRFNLQIDAKRPAVHDQPAMRRLRRGQSDHVEEVEGQRVAD